MTLSAMSVSYDTARPTERRREVSSMPISERPELQNAVLARFGRGSIFRGAVLVLHDEAVASAQAAVRAYMLHEDHG